MDSLFIIDDLIPLGEIGPVCVWGVLMIVCSLLAWAGNIVANRMASAVARDCTRQIRHDLFRKISYLSERRVDEFSIPSLISRMTSDTYVLHQTVGMIQRLGVRAPILLVGGVVVTLTLDPVLTLIMVATLPVVGAVTFYVSRKGTRLFKTVQKASDGMLRVVRENAAGVRVIKALSKSAYERGRFKRVNDDLTEKERTAEKTMALDQPGDEPAFEPRHRRGHRGGRRARQQRHDRDRQDHRVYEPVHNRAERLDGDQPHVHDAVPRGGLLGPRARGARHAGRAL